MSAETVIPWWAPATPEDVPPPTTWRDYWDALFGRLETFYRVELDGSWCMVETADLPSWLEPELDGYAYTVTAVRMTRRQFESLPEFEGF